MRIYLDTAPIIYLIEQVPQYMERVMERLSPADVVQVSSDLTWLECRVRPLRENDTALLQDYSDYFNEAISEIVSLSREVIDRAAEIRAKDGFKTPDAIHLAAATASGCSIFLTNDQRLDRFSDLTIEVVQL